MSSVDRILRAALRSSLLWGALISVAFYVGLPFVEALINPVVMRYIAGGWVAYACVSMFFVGLSALVIKAIDLGQGWFVFHRLNLRAVPDREDTNATSNAIVRYLDGQPRLQQSTYIWRRLRDVFDFLTRKGEQESLDGHLRYLADIDAARMNTSYGVPRFLAWAIPTVGSLGTVLAIALAIGSLSLPAPAPDAQGAPATPLLSDVTANLALAFDAIALALALSFVLILLKFACEHSESQLLDAVEERTHREAMQRINDVPTLSSSEPDQMRFLAERMGELVEKLANSQKSGGATVGQAGGISNEQLESILSRAVAKASTGQPAFTIAGGGQLSDMSQVQEALKQIAAFFSIQQAEHQQESQIVKELSEIIREGNTDWKPRRQTDSMAGSLVGLWNSLND